MTIRSIRNRKSERGNVFFTLFGAVAIVGVLGAGIMATMRGPLSTMVNVNRRTQAEADMNIASKMVLLEATQNDPSNNEGDCDLDGFVEPMPYADPAGADAPVGGGFLPSSVGSNKVDPWGTNYGYCAWDPGLEIDADDCNGQNRLAGNGDGVGDANPDRYTIIAVISAGPDQEFDTTCTGGASPAISKAGGSDDMWSTFSYETAAAMGGGLWGIKQGFPEVAVIDKNIEAQGATFTGPVDLRAAASMFLPNETVATTCNSANIGIVRVNTTTDPDTLEVCDDAADDGVTGPFTWVNVALGAAAISLWQQNALDTDEIYYDTDNVGIGITDPTEALDVVGNVKLTQDLLLATGSAITWGATGAHLSEAASVLELGYGASEINIATGGITLTGNTTITGSGVDGTTNALVVSNGTPSPILIVENDGEVGIGVADPNDKLDVSGSIDLTDGYKIDGNAVLKSDTTVSSTILLGYGAGNSVTTGNYNTILGGGAGATLTTGKNNILIGSHDVTPINVPLATTENHLNIGNLIYGDLANKRIGIGTNTLDDALEVAGAIDATGNINSDASIIAATNITATAGNIVATAGNIEGGDILARGTVHADIYELEGLTNDFSAIPDCDDATDKVIWTPGTGWDCATDLQGGSGGAGQNLEEVLTVGNDAAGLDAVDLGGIAIGSGTLSTGGSQDLELDVTGDIGADFFCDASGNNCFTASTIASGGTSKLNTITAADGDSTIGNAAYNQIWNWQLTGAETGFAFGETAASSGGAGDQYLLAARTLATSTATPFIVTNLGAANSFRVNDETGDADTTPFVIAADGKVGVGVAAPAAVLDVAANGTNTDFRISRIGNAAAYLSISSVGGDNTSSNFTIAGTNVMSLQADGVAMGSYSGGATDIPANSVIIGSEVGINDATPDDGSGSGGQNLYLDVNGATGSAYFCDENGLNCFTAASVAGTGIWEKSGTVIRTRAPTVYATDDFVFGAAQLDDIVGTDDDNRMFFDKSKGAFRAGSSVGVHWDDVNVGTYSFASGWSTWASGHSSTAVGFNNTSAGANSFAGGNNSTARGVSSFGFGDYTVASGRVSYAFGKEVMAGNNTAGNGQGDYSIALGLGDPSSATSATWPRITGVSSYGIFMGDQDSVNISASNIMALLGGRFVIDPDTTSAANVNVSTGVQQLELDVQGDIGAINYCDEAGNNCFTPASVASNRALSAITAATAGNSINNADYAQVWNWNLTTADKDAFTFTENTASTATGHSSILKAATLATSTATPLLVTNLGAGNSFVVNDETGDADTTPFVVDATGSVGIGTATPAAKLHVMGTSPQIQIGDNTTAGGLRFFAGTGTNKTLTMAYDALDRFVLTPAVANQGFYIGPVAGASNFAYVATNINTAGPAHQGFRITVNGTSMFNLDATTGAVGVGNTAPASRFVVAAPSTEVIGAAAVITADACGTVKRLSATANRTTDTTDTFTAPTASYAGCCMDVVNVDTVDTITLDNNAKFITGPGADLAVGPGKAVRVCSDGTSWYQASTVTSAAATILAIDDLSDAFTDYAVENNLIMGRAGAAALTAGAQRNVFIGQNAGATTANSTATTDSNTAVGYAALRDLTTGSQNTAVGRNALSNTTDGVWNVAVGNQALQENTVGNGNVAIGTTALYSNIAKQESTAIGHSAMFYADDTAVGSVTYNTAVGAYALQGSATAANNTGIGNTALGHSALMNNTSGIGNIGIGYAALTNNAGGHNNIGIGYQSMQANTSGQSNIAIGEGAMMTNATRYYNTAVGVRAMMYASSSAGGEWSGNTAFGAMALHGSTTAANNTGQYNTAIGYSALTAMTSGSQNTALGLQAGDSITTGSNNILLGFDIDTPANNTSNHLNIGGTIFGDLANDNVRIGGSGTVAVGPFVATAPAAEAIAGAATITANACGTIKQINSTGNQTTNTTNTFTAPTGYAGCCMDIVNVDAADTITLDTNANFLTGPGTDLALGPAKAVRVCSDGAVWYQAASVTSVASGGNIPISGLTAAIADNSINSGNWNQVWNWQLAAGEVGLTIGENTASTGGSADQYILAAKTLAASTATPFMITNLGAAASFRVNDATGDADTTPFVVDEAGEVGIGTATPGVQLQIHQPTGAFPKMRLTAADVTLPSYSGSASIGDVSATNTIGQIRNRMDGGGVQSGGLLVQGFTGSGVNNFYPLHLVGTHGGTAPTTAAVTIGGQKWSGTNNRAALTSTTPILDIENNYATAGSGGLVMRVMGDGKVGIGTAAPSELLDIVGTDATAHIQANGEGGATITTATSASANQNAEITARRSRGTLAAPTVVQDDDAILGLWTDGYDGDSWVTSSLIQTYIDGTPGDGDMPGRIEFQTQADGGGGNPEGTTPEMVIKNDGSVGIGLADPASRFVVAAPTTEVIGAAAVITADACGTVKRLSATANRTTDTTDTFTAPTASYAGCCMDVVNVDTVDTITLDNNAKFITGPGADLAVGPGKAVRVCSDGTSWYQASTVTSAAATILAIDDLSDAFTDYAVENNLIMGRAGAAALAAGAQRNVFIGQNAGATSVNSTATTDSNTAVGYASLSNLAGGDQNTALGRNTLTNTSSGSYNTAMGNQALQQNTTGHGNTAIGSIALYSNIAKQESTAIGYSAMFYADSSAVSAVTYNTAVGAYALQGSTTAADNTGTANTAIGHSALLGNTSGTNNTALGRNALAGNTQGYSNTAIGSATLVNNDLGQSNVAIGYGVLATNTGSHASTGVGAGALGIATGGRNTALGAAAGDSITTGTDNIVIGFDVDTPANNSTYHLNIGGTIFGDLANDNVRIGGSGVVGAGPFTVAPPSTEVVAAAAVITANACGSIKQLSATANRTTNTTDTFTAPTAAYAGCCMDVVNVDTVDTITLDQNANFFTGPGTDLALGPGKAVRVCSDGTSWYQAASVTSVASGGNIPLSGLTAAIADNTINSGNWNQVWNWQLAAGEVGLTIGENTASTGGSADQYILAAKTLATSTATPFMITNLGAADSFRVNDETGDADTSPFVIQADGDVGIGTSTPATDLSVYGGAVQGYSEIEIGNNAAGKTHAFLSTSADTNGYFSIQSIRAEGTSWGDIVLNQSGGNVGIGIATPGNLLDIHGAIPGVSIFDTDAAISANNPAFRIRSQDNLGSGLAGMAFQTTADYSAYTTGMVMRADGNVGIGIANPDELLDIGADAEKGLSVQVSTSGDPNWNPYIETKRSRGTMASPTAVQNGDMLLDFIISGHDGSGFRNAAMIEAVIDGAVTGGGAADMPARLEFQVQADGAGGWLGDGASTPEMVIKSSGAVGLSIAAPSALLHVNNNGAGDSFRVDDINGDTSPFIVDTSGNVGIGIASPSALLHVNKSSDTYADTMIIEGDGEPAFRINSSSAFDYYNPILMTTRSRGSRAAKTVVASGDSLFEIGVSGYDGAANREAAYIHFAVDGTPGASDMPGRIEFHTQADGAGGGLEGTTPDMVIKNNGNVGIGMASPASKFVVASPTAEVVGAAATITANSCGTVKQISATANRTTNTTDTFTTPTASYAGCCMDVINVDTVDTITLDQNARFFTGSGGDLSLGPGFGVRVCSDGTSWYQAGGVSNATAGSSVLSAITAAAGANSINNGDHAQTWNWALTTADKDAFTFTENAASTATGHSSILKAATLATSTATPLRVTNLGAGDSFVVNDETGDADTSPFVVAADGKVAIGKATPNAGAKLDVNGPLFVDGLGSGNADGLFFGGGGWPYNIGVGWSGYSQLYINAVGTGGGTADFRDLGIMNGKSNMIAFYQGSTKRFSVGGDDTTPDAMLEVIKDAASPLMMLSSAAANNGDLMIVDTNGNVGIGTASPTDLLHVAKDQNGSTAIRLSNATAGASAEAQYEVVTDVGNLYMGMNSSTYSTNPGDTYLINQANTDMRFATNNTYRMIIEAGGDVGIGNTSPASRFVVGSPTAEVVGAAATITANSCGTVKQISATANRTTNTTDTFTTPTASYNGCCMDVVNVDTVDTITLDQNGNFFTGPGTDLALAPGQGVRVCSDGTDWYQAGGVSSATAGSGSSIDGLTDAYADYTTLNNIIMGRASAAALTAGAQYNLFIGENTGATTANSTATTDLNVALGHYALPALTSGGYNTALGALTLQANTSGSDNVAVGTLALNTNVTKIQSTAVGYRAMEFADSAAGGAVTYNTAIGAFALQGNAVAASNTGTRNTALGHSALLSNTSGAYNTALGSGALGSNTDDSSNTAVGYDALGDNTGAGNTAIGATALSSNTEGASNVAVGNETLLVNTDGVNNVAVGAGALFSNATKSESTAVGHYAMFYADSAAGGAITYNTAVGAYALQGSATAADNTGTRNTAVGHSSLSSNTIGLGNVAIGYTALASNDEGNQNTAVGAQALAINTWGNANTALGHLALGDSQNGSNNTALGMSALGANQTGSNNVAVGYNAGLTLTTGGSNILVGTSADTPANNTSNHLNIGGTIFGDLANDNVRIGGSGAVSVGPLVATPPATQTIAGTNTITANACGTIKQLDAGGNVTTNTTNTFTAPTGYGGCCMDVVNVDTVDTITLDQNALFLTGPGTDVALAPGKGVRVCSDGTAWYQAGGVSSASAGTTAISGLTAAAAANSINNADYAQTWNWQLTTADKDAFTFTENTASTATGHSSVLKAATLATSTATPFIVTNLGAANSFVVNDETGDADTSPFIVKADGKVGVGITAPETELHLLNPTSFTTLTIGNPNVIGNNVSDAYIKLYGENAGAVYTGTISMQSMNLFLNAPNSVTTQARSTVIRGNTAGNAVLDTLILMAEDTDSAASNGIGSSIVFNLEGSVNDTYRDAAKIEGVFDDVTDNSKDGSLRFYTMGPNAVSGTTTTTERVRINSSGSVGIGITDPASRFVVASPTAEVVGAAATITANSCGTVKQISATANRTTNTTDTFTTPTASYNGCCMDVVNVDTVDTITLDQNGNFFTGAGTNIALGPGQGVRVCSDGTDWYQAGGVSSAAAGSTALSGVAAAASDATIANAANNIVWNWQLAGAETGMLFGETAASAGGTTGASGDQFIAKASTLATSTATPFIVTNLGAANSFRVNDETGDTDATPFVIAADGKVGVGTSSPSQLLEVYGTTASISLLSNGEGAVTSSVAAANWWENGGFNASRSRGTIAAPTVVQSGDSVLTMWGTAYDGNSWETPALIQYFVDGTPGNGDMPGRIEFQTQADGAAVNPEATTPEMVIKSTGFVGIGIAAPEHLLSLGSDSEKGMGFKMGSANGYENPYIMTERSRGTNASPTVVASGDVIHEFIFNAHDGTNYEEAAYIGVYVDGTPGNDDMPGRIEFNTQPDGSSAWMGDGATTPEMVIKSTGFVGIGMSNPSVSLDVTGDIEYTGTIADVSDIRLKTNIHPLSERGSMLEKLGLVNTYSFTMKDDKEGRVEFGVMAQEIEKIFPELVTTADDEMGTKAVNYSGLIAPMIEAGKELEAQNKAMKAEIDTLKARQDEMKQAMNDITEDMKGLKVHTGYGIGKAEMSLLMILAALGTLGAVGLARRRFGQPRQ